VHGVLDIDELILAGRLPAGKRLWAQAVFRALEASGILSRQDSSYRLNDQELPPPEAVLTSLAWQHPDRAVELLLAAGVGAILIAFGSGQTELAGVSDAAREAFELRSAAAVAAAKALGERLDLALGGETAGRALRILHLGYGASTTEVAQVAARHNARLTVFDPDARRLERTRHRLARSPETSFCDGLADLASHSFDLIVSSGGLSRLSVNRGALHELFSKGAADASLIAIEPAPSLLQNLVFGLSDDWFGDEGEPLRSAESWRSFLTRSGLARVRAEATVHGASAAVDIVARAPESQSAPRLATILRTPQVLIIYSGPAPDDFAVSLHRAVVKQGAECRLARQGETGASGSAPAILVWSVSGIAGDGVGRVATQCMALKALAMGLGSARTHVFVPIDASDRPVAGAVASFLRTLANEIPSFSIHRVEVPRRTSAVVDRLAKIIVSGTDETDIAIRGENVEVLRYAPLKLSDAKATSGEDSWRLEKSPEGGLDRLSWNPSPRMARARVRSKLKS
jgi:hypothetical protein